MIENGIIGPSGWQLIRVLLKPHNEKEKGSVSDKKSLGLTSPGLLATFPSQRVPWVCGSFLVWSVKLERNIWNKSRVGRAKWKPLTLHSLFARIGNRKQC